MGWDRCDRCTLVSEGRRHGVQNLILRDMKLFGKEICQEKGSINSRFRNRRLWKKGGEWTSPLPDTMRVSAPQTLPARTSFEEMAQLGLVNAGSDAQIFIAISKGTRVHPRIQSTIWSSSNPVRALAPEGHGLPVTKKKHWRSRSFNSAVQRGSKQKRSCGVVSKCGHHRQPFQKQYPKTP